MDGLYCVVEDVKMMWRNNLYGFGRRMQSYRIYLMVFGIISLLNKSALVCGVSSDINLDLDRPNEECIFSDTYLGGSLRQV